MSRDHDEASSASAPVAPTPHPASTFNPFVPPYLHDPAPFHARLRREAPVSFNPVLGMWLVSRYDDVCTVVQDPKRFSSADALQSGGPPSPEVLAILAQGFPMAPVPLNSDPPVHTRLRRVLSRGFTPARIAAQEPRIRRICHELIDGFIADGRADLVQQYAMPLPVRVILGLVGVPEEDMEQVKRWCDDSFTLVFGGAPPERQPELARSLVAYQRYCAELIERRRREPRDDLTSDLVTETEGESLSMAELVANISGSLVAAGHETTVMLIAKGLKLLIGQPELWQELKENPSLIPNTIDEVLRFDTPAHGMIRTATEDVELGGVMVPRGARLLILYSSANRDEAHFPDADQFDIHRKDARHLAFGYGIHYCLGAQLARLEARIAFELLIGRLPTPRLVPDQDFGYMLNLTIHGFHHLRVEWTPPGAR